MKCPKCQFDNKDDVKFCNECGFKLRVYCIDCGNVNPLDSLFCNKCGCKIDEIAGLKKKEVSSKSERKHITILFSDLSGYTAMTEKLDPESVRMILSRIFQKISMIITKYDGFIERYVGDSVMAVFGIPKAHEDDPIRAIRAAIEIHDSVKSISHWVKEKTGRRLYMHTGINTGLTLTGKVNPEKGTHGLTGFTINIASRLESLSKADEILVGHNTYTQAENNFNFKELEPAKVKGKSEPLRIYKVLSKKEKIRRIRSFYNLRFDFIGREKEMSQFKERVGQLRKGGGGGIISIIGDAGIGKSRLLAECKSQLADDDLLWIESRSLSYGQEISYWPFLDILKNFAGITDEDDDIKGWEKLEIKINRLFSDEVANTLPYLATLLSLGVKGNLAERVRFLDGEAMKRQIFRTSLRFLQRLAQEQPLILEFEDFHWTDQSTVELIEHLLPLTHDVPLLMCFVARPTHNNPSASLREIVTQEHYDYLTEISLYPLSNEETIELISRMLDLKEISPQMRDLVLRKCEGNPLFLEELIRTLVNLGTVHQNKRSGKWRINQIEGEIHIPDTLQGLIVSSIDRMDRDIKELLNVASVIGRTFLYRLLKAIEESRVELDKHLSVLQKEDLIREKTRIPELEYIFKHDLIKDAAYESILLQQRRKLHQKVGEAIEKIFEDHLDNFYGLLAYHYAQAENWGKAQDYLFKAGDQAEKVAADSEALAHYKKAVAAYKQVFGKQLDPLQRAVFERKIGEILFRRGEHQRAIDCLQRALTYIGRSFPTSRWGIRFAVIKNIIRQAFHYFLPSLFVKDFTTHKDSSFDEWLRICEIMGWIDFFSNRERFLLNVITGLNFAEQKGDIYSVARASMGVGMVCDVIGRFRLAEHYHRRAVDLAEKSQDPIALGTCYLGMGIHNDYMGNWDRSIESYERAEKIYQNIGDIHKWGSPFSMKSVLFCLKGEFKKSLELFREITQIAQEMADHQMLGWGLHGIGMNLLYIGELNEAIISLHKSIEILQSVPDYYGLALATSDLGMCFLRKGETEQALAVLEKSVQYIKKYGIMVVHMTIPLNRLAEAYLFIAEQIETDGRPEKLKKAKQACKAALMMSKRFKGGRPYAYRLKGTYHWLKNQRITAKKWWRKSIEAGEQLGAKYHLGMTYFEMGKRMEDSTYLEQAMEIFDHIGAKLDLTQAQDLLKCNRKNE